MMKLAKRYTVIYIVAEIRTIFPRFDMMSF